MDIQTIFYSVGTIFLVLCILILLGIAYILIQIKNAIQEVQTTASAVRYRIENMKSISAFGDIARWGVTKLIAKIRNRA